MALNGTQKDLAALLGVSRETIRLRVKDGTLPGLAADGRYDFAAAVQAWIRYAVTQARPDAPEDDEQERQRYDRLRADMVELDLMERRQETATATEFAELFGEACDRVASKLKALPNRLAPVIVGVTDVADGLERITPIIQEAWEELYQAEDVPSADDAAA